MASNFYLDQPKIRKVNLNLIWIVLVGITIISLVITQKELVAQIIERSNLSQSN